MALQLPNRTPLRRAVMIAALGVPLLAPAAAGAQPAHVASAAKKSKAKPVPTVRSVRPMQLAVGDTLEIRGRNFVRGRGKNTVVFQRDGAKAVFVKAEIGTTKLLKVKIPDRLESFLKIKDGAGVPTRFHIRILASRFGKRFTRNSLSPVIRAKAASAPGGSGPAPIAVVLPSGQSVPVAPPVVAPADGDCDGDGVTNGADPDDDNDLLADPIELSFGLEPCKADTDGDTVGDGYEYRSARDLNDDEYQEPGRFLPYPGKRPYPNPLDGTDRDLDFDGDVLTLSEEFRLWVEHGNRAAGLDGLNYSDGLQCSVAIRLPDGRRRSSLRADGYDKQAEFLAWAATTPNLDTGAGGYLFVYHPGGSYDPQPAGLYDIRDVNHDGEVRDDASGGYASSERHYYDFDDDGYLCDNERDEDADGLTNYDEAHGRVRDDYWKAQYPQEKPFAIAYGGTDLTDPDSDGDGVRDGADDLDHDDIPNLAELSRHAATGDVPGTVAPRGFTDPGNLPDPADSSQRQGRVNPLNPCLPNRSSRTCLRHPPFGGNAPAPFDNSPSYFVFN